MSILFFFTNYQSISSRSLQEPWDQKEFEMKLIEYIVACAAPFDEVNKPEFQALLQYTHHSQHLYIFLRPPQLNARS
jgi:hypothetical protein